MSADLQTRTMTEIMATAADVLGAAGARIAGGHSSLGAELTIGFTLTGLTDAPITLAGAQVGDVIILTKPIGSGTTMAGEMAGRAQGADVIACLELMQQDQAQAAAILHDAHAMTDVTGFGLLGHLRGICDASGVGAVLRSGEIPIMQGCDRHCSLTIWQGPERLPEKRLICYLTRKQREDYWRRSTRAMPNRDWRNCDPLAIKLRSSVRLRQVAR